MKKQLKSMENKERIQSYFVHIVRRCVDEFGEDDVKQALKYIMENLNGKS